MGGLSYFVRKTKLGVWSGRQTRWGQSSGVWGMVWRWPCPGSGGKEWRWRGSSWARWGVGARGVGVKGNLEPSRRPGTGCRFLSFHVKFYLFYFIDLFHFDSLSSLAVSLVTFSEKDEYHQACARRQGHVEIIRPRTRRKRGSVAGR